jgi:hypothetical protein
MEGRRSDENFAVILTVSYNISIIRLLYVDAIFFNIQKRYAHSYVYAGFGRIHFMGCIRFVYGIAVVPGSAFLEQVSGYGDGGYSVSLLLLHLYV